MKTKFYYGLTALFLALASLTLAAGTATTIKPGALWPDDRGEHINAHGGGILKLSDTWYWFGEYRPKDAVPGRRYVSCYSSTDLVNWKFCGLPIDMAAPENIGPNWVLERPKVYYNATTKKFVMYLHIDGPLDPNEPDPTKAYKIARVGVAVSDTVEGPYTYLRSFRPLGQESRDIGQFIDDDGSAYLIFESRPTKGFFIAKLSDDYLDVIEQTAFIQAPIEGGALVHYDGLYYLLGSALTGWAPNPNKYATANDLKGPWSEFKDIAPPETKTYHSQSTMLLKIVGTKKTTVIFMGDQWKPKTQWDSRYLWMPVEIGNGRLWLPEPQEWTLDVKSGASAIITPQRASAAEAIPAKKDVINAMTLANNYFMAKWPKAGSHDLPKKRPCNIWTRGVYFEGALALRPQARRFSFTGWPGESTRGICPPTLIYLLPPKAGMR
ncbi:family 43 glycosylhydrolase [Termitidicoccus mucosus]|uniref:family 43 glycosylhydrolase n=1 Tax=Termitidicoccus mucosus TaxID=1184151 RepID=UPI000838D563